MPKTANTTLRLGETGAVGGELNGQSIAGAAMAAEEGPFDCSRAMRMAEQTGETYPGSLLDRLRQTRGAGGGPPSNREPLPKASDAAIAGDGNDEEQG